MRTTWIACLGLLLAPVIAQARTWTDNSGQHRLDADFVELSQGKVRLQTADGRLYSIALEKLSDSDRQRAIREASVSADASNAAVPQTLTALQSSGPAGATTAAPASAPAGSTLGDPLLRQTPAPLPPETPPLTTQPPAAPSTLPQPGAGAMPANEAGGQQDAQQPTYPQPAAAKDKRIFSGCRSTFHLYGRDGTAAYWIDSKHYLAKLSYLGTNQNYIYFLSTGEGGVQAWALHDVDGCIHRVYGWIGGRWQLFDYDYREVPN